jgi:hypothetical protein
VNRISALFSLLLLFLSLDGFGQPEYSALEVKKPAKYEERVLGAEKTDTKKFTTTRHFIQNTVTHYNYYYNANNKLNEVLATSKFLFKDDYTKLLSFYNYTLDLTSKNRRELDSVIYKCTNGLLIHDLRNDWSDNLYMLLGKAYYFRNLLDSAHITFQFVNFQYAPKEKGGYYKPIGSNANADEGGNAFSISTLEKRNLPKKILTLPPSRNESFIWLTKTYIAQNKFPQAGVLIEILKHDPQFPARLQPDLEEAQAWLFYKQEMYDSSAGHLVKALPNALDNEEKSRWEYLIAQMYEHIEKYDLAKEYYEKVFLHTYNPVLEVYARLNFIRQNRGNDQVIQQNVDALTKMGKRDRYIEYRDIIYFTIAKIELERHNIPGAEAALLKCTKYALPNSSYKNQAFLLLGDLAFDHKKYKPAKNFYDSVNVQDKTAVENIDLFNDRKTALDKIVMQLDIIERQDSLQHIAGLSKAEREAYVKKLAKQLRIQQGLKDEEQQLGTQGFSFNNNNSNNNLFNRSPDNTDWYFYNSSLKSRGYNEFKSKWGTRENVDNWQLASLSSQQLSQRKANNEKIGQNGVVANAIAPQITFAALMANLPLTPEKMKVSNDSVEKALFLLGKAYQEGLPDYNAAIDAYEKLLSRYPSTNSYEETLFNLYYCYKKIGDEVNAARILNLMKQKFPTGKLTKLAADPKSVNFEINAVKADATKKYEDIYTAFIEGRFEEAQAEKKVADSMYGKKYWTPQLLYIESVYYIRQRMDSLAKVELANIINEYKNTPMASKAKNLLDVLARRREIEEYLTNLKIERAKDDSVIVSANTYTPATKIDSAKNALPKEDTAQMAKAKMKLTTVPTNQKQKQDSLQSSLQKIKLSASDAAKIKLDSAMQAQLKHMQDSIGNAMKKMHLDSVKMAQLKHTQDSIQLALQKIRKDSIELAHRLQDNIKTVFTYTPDQPHSVVIVMNKVDPVYVSEARNAFLRYNKESYYNKPMEINNSPLNDTLKLVVISGFPTAAEALDYMTKARLLSSREIVPWLPQGKYFFIIITDQNLELLKKNQDLSGYQKYLSVFFPGKF